MCMPHCIKADFDQGIPICQIKLSYLIGETFLEFQKIGRDSVPKYLSVEELAHIKPDLN